MNIITSSKTKIALSVLGKLLFFVGIVTWTVLVILANLLKLILIAIVDDNDVNPGLSSIYNFRTGELDTHQKFDGIYDDDMFW